MDDEQKIPNIQDAVQMERCGCQSKLVSGPNGQKGRSVTPCPEHAMQRAAESLAEAARMLGHIASSNLQRKLSGGGN